jgi:hypothetical protein
MKDQIITKRIMVLPWRELKNEKKKKKKKGVFEGRLNINLSFLKLI